MSAAYLCPILQEPQWNDDALFLTGGQIWFYAAGTTTPQTAYQNETATVAWPNPIVLNARGETGGQIWLAEGTPYKLILESAPMAGNAHGTIISDYDNITGVNDPSANPLQADWQSFLGTPTFLTATTFSLSGDQTQIFTPNRRIKSDCTAGVQTGMVQISVYNGTLTTITVINDVGSALDNGMSDIYYGFIETDPSSIPVAVLTGTSTTADAHTIKIGYNGTNLTSTVDSTDFGSNWPINITGSAGPTGTVIMFAANTPPAGYLTADGSQVSRTTYANLFGVIGTSFGAGDGSLTFNLPNLIGKFMRGWDSDGVTDITTITATGTLDGTTATITAMSSVAGLFTGQKISGTGIPSGATVVSVGVSSIVISANTTVSGTGVTLTFNGRQFGSSEAASNNPIGLTDPGHAHTITKYGATSGGPNGPTDGSTTGAAGTFTTNSNTTGITITGSGVEARPVNVALLPCIKY